MSFVAYRFMFRLNKLALSREVDMGSMLQGSE